MEGINRILLLIGALLCVLSGCAPAPDSMEYDQTKQAALDRFIERENITGTLVQLNVDGRVGILLAEYRTRAYYVGEWIETEEGFSAVKLSPTFDIENTSGVTWDFKTLDGDQYSISTFKEKQANIPTYIKELDLYVSIVKKGSKKEPTPATHDLIDSYEVLL
ncbi:hypothetical protein AMS62_21050 [Bacillus sp. FJAT-18019]|nr:hypothetical protein AMS62_21050 [Bacillus sp. FJAT-18019]